MLIEECGIPDVYIDDVGTVELLSGGNVRISYVTYRGPPNDRQVVCVLKVVRPISSLNGKLWKMVADLHNTATTYQTSVAELH